MTEAARCGKAWPGATGRFPFSRRFPSRRRRGLSLAGMTLAASLTALAAAEWARLELREQRRTDAEAAAAEIAVHAETLDHWLHAGDQAAVMRPGPSAPERPRMLTAAETDAVTAPAGPAAAPWSGTGGNVSTQLPAPPVGARWHVRFAVGWPSADDPAAAGSGPPHGVVIAEPLTARAAEDALRIRAALRRRGGSSADPDPASAAPAAGDTAVAIAAAAGLTVNAGDLVVPAWVFSRIPRHLALRHARAGHPPPGMDTDLSFAAGAGLTAGRIEAGTAVIGEVVSLPGQPAPRVSGGTLTVTRLKANRLAVRGQTSVGGDIVLDGRLTAGEFSASGGIDLSGTGTLRHAAVAGDVSATEVKAEAVSAEGDVALSGALTVSGLLAAHAVDAAVIDVARELRILGLLYAPSVDLTGSGLEFIGGGLCRGC